MDPDRCPRLLALALVAGGLAACATAEPPAEAAPAPATDVPAEAQVVDVTAIDYAFEGPDTIASGWTTFRLHNEGEEPHLLFVQRLPDGRTFDDYAVDVGGPFNEVWYQQRAGEIDRPEMVELLGEVLPEWFWTMEPRGGVGVLVPGLTGQTTVRLQPGDYVIECYVKTPEGEFHGTEGMVRPLHVTDEDSGGSAPEADVRITLTADALTAPEELTAGTHTFAVDFAGQPAEGFLHDVHLARLDEAGVSEAVYWINWMNVDGLQTPAPTTFLGGTHEMPEGETAYFTLDLTPGEYLWVSEVTGDQGIVAEFTVR